jgi:RimJ/RimL family protein N-acetyltransferase
MSHKRFLSTKRLYLEKLSFDDLEIVFELNRDPEVMKYIAPADTDISQTKIFLENTLKFNRENPKLGVWKLYRKDDTFLGFALLNRPKLSATGKRDGPIQLGYRIHKAYWGNGYVTEISHALVNYAFEVLKLETLIAITEPPNVGSARVMEKVGMEFQGITEEFYNIKLLKYHITRYMWEGMKA